MSNKRSGAGLLGKDYQSRPLPQSNLNFTSAPTTSPVPPIASTSSVPPPSRPSASNSTSSPSNPVPTSTTPQHDPLVTNFNDDKRPLKPVPIMKPFKSSSAFRALKQSLGKPNDKGKDKDGDTKLGSNRKKEEKAKALEEEEREEYSFRDQDEIDEEGEEGKSSNVGNGSGIGSAIVGSIVAFGKSKVGRGKKNLSRGKGKEEETGEVSSIWIKNWEFEDLTASAGLGSLFIDGEKIRSYEFFYQPKFIALLKSASTDEERRKVLEYQLSFFPSNFKVVHPSTLSNYLQPSEYRTVGDVFKEAYPDWFSQLPQTDELDTLSSKELKEQWMQEHRPGGAASGLFNLSRDGCHPGVDSLLSDYLLDSTLLQIYSMTPNRATIQADLHLARNEQIPLPTLLQLVYIEPNLKKTAYGVYTGYGPGLDKEKLEENVRIDKLLKNRKGSIHKELAEFRKNGTVGKEQTKWLERKGAKAKEMERDDQERKELELYIYKGESTAAPMLNARAGTRDAPGGVYRRWFQHSIIDNWTLKKPLPKVSTHTTFVWDAPGSFDPSTLVPFLNCLIPHSTPFSSSLIATFVIAAEQIGISNHSHPLNDALVRGKVAVKIQSPKTLPNKRSLLATWIDRINAPHLLESLNKQCGGEFKTNAGSSEGKSMDEYRKARAAQLKLAAEGKKTGVQLIAVTTAQRVKGAFKSHAKGGARERNGINEQLAPTLRQLLNSDCRIIPRITANTNPRLIIISKLGYDVEATEDEMKERERILEENKVPGVKKKEPKATARGTVRKSDSIELSSSHFPRDGRPVFIGAHFEEEGEVDTWRMSFYESDLNEDRLPSIPELADLAKPFSTLSRTDVDFDDYADDVSQIPSNDSGHLETTTARLKEVMDKMLGKQTWKEEKDRKKAELVATGRLPWLRGRLIMTVSKANLKESRYVVKDTPVMTSEGIRYWNVNVNSLPPIFPKLLEWQEQAKGQDGSVMQTKKANRAQKMTRHQKGVRSDPSLSLVGVRKMQNPEYDWRKWTSDALDEARERGQETARIAAEGMDVDLGTGTSGGWRGLENVEEEPGYETEGSGGRRSAMGLRDEDDGENEEGGDF